MVFCPTKRPLEFDRRICTEQSNTVGLNLTKPRYKKRPRLKFGLRSGAAVKVSRTSKAKFKHRTQPSTAKAKFRRQTIRIRGPRDIADQSGVAAKTRPKPAGADRCQIFKFYALFCCFRYLSKCGRFLKSQAPLRLRNRANFTSAASASSSLDNTLPA